MPTIAAPCSSICSTMATERLTCTAVPPGRACAPCLVVMQPTFLPWAGYFNLMARADHFVFLDDVQLEKQSWQTRNRWLIGGQVHWITVPVRHTHLAQTIAETQVVDASHWRDKLTRGFAQHYGRHRHFADAREIIEALRSHPAQHLGALHEAVIRHIAARLGLAPQLHRASDLPNAGPRSQRLVGLCRALGAARYLSPQGSADYLAEDHFAEQSPATLQYQDYHPQPYPQTGAASFVSHLSIVDVVANLGWAGARHYVDQGSSTT
jgi:WbqC-like protein family